ncbi:carboxylating nicotinate-nucleotide diphosphorylase [Parvularcula dongshanensis]|uniref:Probable nicotinate-nucleotide pyrophosphorylase [carboxylating] n=1 Tax=Parvularcula dongshanensis TaxID=1173995 RepID=A0A840I3R8_9PROT|nr:carboxylating nicotinate-nucleotide diphosphorylase [Parvularcula dongshanensis]MBB4658975.1 nicotinate-nucleotide pyrophosphorylase (carboxylating) [Parvularcula dongshanensis]
MIPFPLPPALTEPLIRRALEEDLGDAGDVTTLATVPADRQAVAEINARKAGHVAGVELARRVFRLVDTTLEVSVEAEDGARLAAGGRVMTVKGAARSLLTAERVALNLLGHLSGVATATAALVRAVEGTGARIVCTRKTLPGLRAAQKHAVLCGGGHNHRFGLHDAAMIKDNHIVAAGGLTPALRAARAALGHMVKIEVEVDRLDQLEEALMGGADVVLLDNMTPEALREAVRLTAGRAVLEASGNVTIDTVRGVAETGVDVISSGWITHSAPNLDIGLDLTL